MQEDKSPIFSIKVLENAFFCTTTRSFGYFFEQQVI